MDASVVITDLEKLGDEFITAIHPLVDEQSIRATQAQFLGKKGKVSEVMKQLATLPPADRPRVGMTANKVKQLIEERTLAKLDDL